MRDFAPLHRRIQDRIDSIVQDYASSNLNGFHKHLKEIVEFVDTLAISEQEKEALRLVMEYHRLLVEDCLRHLETLNSLRSQTATRLFSTLSPEEQRAAIRHCADNPLLVIRGGQR